MLPVGKHNLFLTGIGDDARCFAEAGGRITGEAVKVKVSHYNVADRKPIETVFEEEGSWCFRWCWFPCFFFCCADVLICF